MKKRILYRNLYLTSAYLHSQDIHRSFMVDNGLGVWFSLRLGEAVHWNCVRNPFVRKSRLLQVFPEPEPAGWKPAILATRPCGITKNYNLRSEAIETLARMIQVWGDGITRCKAENGSNRIGVDKSDSANKENVLEHSKTGKYESRVLKKATRIQPRGRESAAKQALFFFTFYHR